MSTCGRSGAGMAGEVKFEDAEREIVLAAVKSDILAYQTHLTHVRPGDAKYPSVVAKLEALKSAKEKLDAGT